MTDSDKVTIAIAGDLIADAPLSIFNFGVCDLVQACGAMPAFTANCGPDARRWELSNQDAGERLPGPN